MSQLAQRIASRYLQAYEADQMSKEELTQMVSFLTSQVSSLDPASVCYGTYCCSGLQNAEKRLTQALFTALARKYKGLLLEWFQYALVKRANVGGGGTGIQKLENALSLWVNSIPETLAGSPALDLESLLAGQDYIESTKLTAVARKIFYVVAQEYKQQALVRTARLQLPKWPLRRDPSLNIWFIDSNSTFAYKDALGSRGLQFRWNPVMKRWETPRVTPEMRTYFEVEGPVVAPKLTTPVEAIRTWFFDSWLPGNIARFTKVFTDYARNVQSSYKILFTLSGGKVTVTFKRQISTMRDAIEELRYRYIGRQGREPWLEVLDKVIELAGAQEPNQILHIIDRVNNLQHSNGLFLEHFPKNVQSWYVKMLNAKYAAPTVSHLSRMIPDKDLRDLFSWLGTLVGQSYVSDLRFQPLSVKQEDLKPEETSSNWRARGYPAHPGYTQVNRFDPQVQRGLDRLA